MEVDKKKLERYIAKKCPDVEYSAYNDELRCYHKIAKACREWGLSVECPHDCPHINSSPVRCTEGKCKYVKKEIEKLTSP